VTRNQTKPAARHRAVRWVTVSRHLNGNWRVSRTYVVHRTKFPGLLLKQGTTDSFHIIPNTYEYSLQLTSSCWTNNDIPQSKCTIRWANTDTKTLHFLIDLQVIATMAIELLHQLRPVIVVTCSWLSIHRSTLINLQTEYQKYYVECFWCPAILVLTKGQEINHYFGRLNYALFNEKHIHKPTVTTGVQTTVVK
jgi:hypothetical protein